MTSPIKTIDRSVKLNLAIEAQLKPQLKAKELAEQFGMSETTAKRAIKQFFDEACKIIDQRVLDEEAALAAAELAAKNAPALTAVVAPIVALVVAAELSAADAPVIIEAPAVAPAAPAATTTPKPRAVGTDIARGEKGFKPRNGRWTVLNALFAEKGFDDAAALYIEANKRGVAAGLKELNRGSFYSMLSMAKKKSLTASASPASVKDVNEDVSKDDNNTAADTSTSNDAGAADTDKS